MSGTTAMTGRTAERIDTHGIADITAHIAPFFQARGPRARLGRGLVREGHARAGTR
jgi:hypothetical protein